MTNEQYVEIINRAAKNLLDSTKDYKKVYNSNTHGTKTDYMRVKQTKDKEEYRTGLNNLPSNITDSDGKIKQDFEHETIKEETVSYKVPNPNYDPEEPDKEPKEIEQSKTVSQSVKELDTDAIAEVSNTGMALTHAYAIAQEIGILRDEYDKKIQDMRNEYDKKIRDLQNEIQNIKTKVGLV